MTEIVASLLRVEKFPLTSVDASLHISVLLKLKQGTDWFARLRTKMLTQLPVSLQPHPCTQLASLPLRWMQLPSSRATGMQRERAWFCRALFKVGAGCARRQAPAFASSILGRPCGSCPALNPSTGTACKVNCSTAQCFTSAIYILPVTE